MLESEQSSQHKNNICNTNNITSLQWCIQHNWKNLNTTYFHKLMKLFARMCTMTIDGSYKAIDVEHKKWRKKLKTRTSHYLKMQTLDRAYQCYKNKRCSFEQGCNNGSSLKVPRPNISANIGTTYKCNTYTKYSLTTQQRKIIIILSICKVKKETKNFKNHITQKQKFNLEHYFRWHCQLAKKFHKTPK